MIARLTVQRGETTEYPLAERVRGGWQNGVVFYPDTEVVKVVELEVRTVQGEPDTLPDGEEYGEFELEELDESGYEWPDDQQGELSDAQELLTEADALVESWDRKGSWSSDSPVGLVMRLARALRAAAAIEGGER